MAKKVALVLASGGARGLAHIGAIEELMARGYEISSIAGCSIGSLIGGIYAAGKIEEAREWFCALDRKDVLSLTDFSIGLSHLVKGNRVMEAIQEWVPDRQIEDLPIPAAFVATDVLNSEEVIFRSGSLFEAIRASISIPMCFEPVRYNDTLLVDGGLTNPLPLDRVERTEGDILVAVNISGRTHMEAERNLLDAPDFIEKLGQMDGRLGRIGKRINNHWDKINHELNDDKLAPSFNYLTLVNRTIDVQIQAACQARIEMCKPDIVVNMPQDAFTTFDFDKAEIIIEEGRRLMKEALDKFENDNHDDNHNDNRE